MEKSKKPGLPRLVYTILFLIVGRLVSIVVCFAAIIQFIYSFVFAEPNKKILDFTSSLAEFAKQIVSYVGQNSEKKPWPLGEEWPKASK